MGQFSPAPVAMSASSSAWYGPDGPKWFGHFSSTASTPAYLKGEYPGDYGWDSAGLAADPKTCERYREAELMHARWATLGTAGCLGQEILLGQPWFKAGASIFADVGFGLPWQP